MNDDLAPIILETQPDKPASAAVIWLHGLGADGSDFVPVVPELKLPESVNIRFVFPHAPVRPITINQGYHMRGWYDITSLDIANRDDDEGIRQSAQIMSQLCDEQIASGIAANRIIFAGFSQGGAIALFAGLRYPQKLAGIMALSTYLPLGDTLAQEASAENRDTPIFMAHGLNDDIVAYEFGIRSCSRLKQQNYPVQWSDYPMAHSVSIEEIRDIGNWITETLSC